eukprot:4470070-Amphidinium_carterae.1
MVNGILARALQMCGPCRAVLGDADRMACRVLQWKGSLWLEEAFIGKGRRTLQTCTPLWET